MPIIYMLCTLYLRGGDNESHTQPPPRTKFHSYATGFICCWILPLTLKKESSAMPEAYDAVMFTGSPTGILERNEVVSIIVIFSIVILRLPSMRLSWEGWREVMSCVKNADILKPAKTAAEGLLKEIAGDDGGKRYT